MKNSKKIKLISAIGCFSGLLCAFSTGMFLASGSLYSLPALLMAATTVFFLVSVILYIFWSR